MSKPSDNTVTVEYSPSSKSKVKHTHTHTHTPRLYTSLRLHNPLSLLFFFLVQMLLEDDRDRRSASGALDPVQRV